MSEIAIETMTSGPNGFPALLSKRTSTDPEKKPCCSASTPRTSRDDILAAYLNDIGRIPLLSITEERRLFERLDALRDRLREDPENGRLRDEIDAVKHRIVCANLRLCVVIAKKFRGRGLSLADLIQEGSIGMMKAVEKFDRHRGVRFAAYASWWIQQAMGLAIATYARTVRLPSYLLEWQRRLRQIREDHDEQITVNEMAEQLGLSEEQAQRALDAEIEFISLDSPTTIGGGRTVAEVIEDVDGARPDGIVEEKELREIVESALASLDPRSARVLRLRYGLEDGVSRSLKEVGDELQLSRERIRQLEAAAFQRLKHPARAARLRALLPLAASDS